MSARQSDVIWAAVFATAMAGFGLWLEIGLPFWGWAIVWVLAFLFFHKGNIKDRIRDRQAYGPD